MLPRTKTLKLAIFGFLFLSICSMASNFLSSLISNLTHPERTIVSSALPLQLKWQYKFAGLLNAPIIYSQDLIYIPHTNLLNAIESKTGRVRWMYDARESAFVGEPIISQSRPGIAISDGIIVIHTDYEGREAIIGLDAATGEMRWKKSAYTVYSIAVGDGLLFVGSAGHVTAYNLKQGLEVWKIAVGSPTHSVIDVRSNGKTLYVFNDGNIYALNAETGTTLDLFDANEPNDPIDFEIVSKETLLSVTKSEIVARDTNTGLQRWVNKVSSNNRYIAPTLLFDKLYAIPYDGNLRLLDAETGVQKWVADQIEKPFSNVIEFMGKGYVISRDGCLQSFDVITGQKTGTLNTSLNEIIADRLGVPAIPSLAVVGDVLVVTFGDSYIYGFEKTEQ